MIVHISTGRKKAVRSTTSLFGTTSWGGGRHHRKKVSVQVRRVYLYKTFNRCNIVNDVFLIAKFQLKTFIDFRRAFHNMQHHWPLVTSELGFVISLVTFLSAMKKKLLYNCLPDSRERKSSPVCTHQPAGTEKEKIHKICELRYTVQDPDTMLSVSV